MSPLLPKSCVYYLFDHLLHDARNAVGFILESFMMQVLDHDPSAHHPDGIGGDITEASRYRCGSQILLPFGPVFGTAPGFHALVDWEEQRVEQRNSFDIHLIAYVDQSVPV